MKNCPSCHRSYSESYERCPEDGALLEQGASLAPDPTDRFIGRVLGGRYRIESRLGAGSVGVVFRGVDLPLNRWVAVKLLLPRGFMEPRAARRLKREFRALSTLDNPHIVKAYALGETEEQIPFLVMEYVEGQDLGALLAERRHLEPARALRLTAQILDALQNAHAGGVIHRDLKADNVHLTQMHGVPDFVKVLDFGLVKFYDIGERNHATSLTAAHLVVGTPHYMAPEQIRGGDLGPWTDLYALGILMYRMLTGELPFPGVEPIAVMRAHCHDLPLPLRTFQPDIPPELERLVLALLEKDPRSRPGSASAVLEHIYSGSMAALWQQPVEPTQQPLRTASQHLPITREAAVLPGPERSAAPGTLPSSTGSYRPPLTFSQPPTLQARTTPYRPLALPRLPIPEPSYLWLAALSWGVAVATAIVVVAILS